MNRLSSMWLKTWMKSWVDCHQVKFLKKKKSSCVDDVQEEDDHHGLMILKSLKSKGCIMGWCTLSWRGDDLGLIIKSSEECIIRWCMWRSQGDDHELIIMSKRRSIMGWWRASGRLHHVLMHIKTWDEGCRHALMDIKSRSRSEDNHHVLMIMKSRTWTWSEDARHQASSGVQGKGMTS